MDCYQGGDRSKKEKCHPSCNSSCQSACNRRCWYHVSDVPAAIPFNLDATTATSTVIDASNSVLDGDGQTIPSQPRRSVNATAAAAAALVCYQLIPSLLLLILLPPNNPELCCQWKTQQMKPQQISKMNHPMMKSLQWRGRNVKRRHLNANPHGREIEMILSMGRYTNLHHQRWRLWISVKTISICILQNSMNNNFSIGINIYSNLCFHLRVSGCKLIPDQFARSKLSIVFNSDNLVELTTHHTSSPFLISVWHDEVTTLHFG